MPWHIDSDHSDCKGFAVVQDSNNKVVGCHATKAKAQKQLAALNINVKEGVMSTETITRPPRDNLFRAQAFGYELREDGDGMPTMLGHFSVFNQWTEIHSFFEGHFLERISPGAFKKTFQEDRERMRALFQHGRDPQIGDKVLGPIDELKEDDKGAYYEVPLLDTSYNRDLVPGLKKNLYGSSFRFRVIREEFNKKPAKSAHNPEGIPEREVKEVEVREFGPVTFPAYASATAGIRSLTDEFVLERFIHDPKHLAEIIEFARQSTTTEPAPSTPTPEESTSGPERRVSVDAFLQRRANG